MLKLYYSGDSMMYIGDSLNDIPIFDIPDGSTFIDMGTGKHYDRILGQWVAGVDGLKEALLGLQCDLRTAVMQASNDYVLSSLI